MLWLLLLSSFDITQALRCASKGHYWRLEDDAITHVEEVPTASECSNACHVTSGNYTLIPGMAHHGEFQTTSGCRNEKDSYRNDIVRSDYCVIVRDRILDCAYFKEGEDSHSEQNVQKWRDEFEKRLRNYTCYEGYDDHEQYMSVLQKFDRFAQCKGGCEYELTAGKHVNMHRPQNSVVGIRGQCVTQNLPLDTCSRIGDKVHCTCSKDNCNAHSKDSAESNARTFFEFTKNVTCTAFMFNYTNGRGYQKLKSSNTVQCSGSCQIYATEWDSDKWTMAGGCPVFENIRDSCVTLEKGGQLYRVCGCTESGCKANVSSGPEHESQYLFDFLKELFGIDRGYIVAGGSN